MSRDSLSRTIFIQVRANDDIVVTYHEDKERHLIADDDAGAETKGVAYTDTGVPLEFRVG